MKLDPYLRKELINEIRYCSNKMIEQKDLQRKMFFYEQIQYAVARTMEFSYDRHLSFIELVLEISHKVISKRVDAIVTEEDTTVPLISGFIERLVENSNELATKIEKDEDTFETLEKIVELTYLTTESGYYQSMKGQIKL